MLAVENVFFFKYGFLDVSKCVTFTKNIKALLLRDYTNVIVQTSTIERLDECYCTDQYY